MPEAIMTYATQMNVTLLSQEPWNLLLRIFVAAILGGTLGIERDIHGRQAGLRTHILVSAGAALFFILSTHIATLDVIVPDEFTKVTDPGRIAAQIVTGIGFLGAGVILKEGFTVVGLTTAACLWISAAIGMTAGAGLYAIAVSTTILSLFSLVLLRWLERYYRKDIYRHLELQYPNEFDVLSVIDAVKGDDLTIISLDLDRDYESMVTTAIFSLRYFHKGDAGALSHRMLEKLENSQIPLKSFKWVRH
ncbi:MAG: MgtC/SapB family protein [Desulfosarcinaceae bacterium]